MKEKENRKESNNIRSNIKIEGFDFKYGWYSENGRYYVAGNYRQGDIIDGYIYKKRKGKKFIRSLTEIKTSCKYSNICGGCSFRRFSYNEQLEIKKDYLKNVLNIKDIEVLGDEQIANDREGYRNKVELTFGQEGENLFLGYHLPGNFYRIFNVDECKLFNYKRIYEVVKRWADLHGLKAYNKRKHTGELRHLLIRRGVFSGEYLVLLHTTTSIEENLINDLLTQLDVNTFIWYKSDDIGDAIKNGESVIKKGKGFITEKIGNISFLIGPFTFFQTNSYMMKVLYDEIKKQIGSGDRLLDLYGGIGSIGMYLSDKFEEILSIDENCQSVEQGRLVARLNDIKNITIECKRIEDIELIGYDTIIVDPPRSGLSPSAMKNILKINPYRLLYVSCNPETFARDRDILFESGYNLNSLKGIDMFPYTRHLELVSLFVRR